MKLNSIRHTRPFIDHYLLITDHIASALVKDQITAWNGLVDVYCASSAHMWIFICSCQEPWKCATVQHMVWEGNKLEFLTYRNCVQMYTWNVSTWLFLHQKQIKYHQHSQNRHKIHLPTLLSKYFLSHCNILNEQLI